MSNLTDFFSGGGVKSVQRGTQGYTSGVTSIDVTISEVNLSKAIALITNSDEDVDYAPIGVALTSSTNLRIYKDSGSTGTAYWQVVEFN